jgi:hypothetical protein
LIWAAGLVFLLLILLAPKRVFAAVSEEDVIFDFEQEYVYVREPGEGSLCYCIIQKGKPTDNLKMVPVSKRAVVWRNLEGEERNYYVIDISSISTSKPMVLCLKVHADDTEVCTVDIPAQKKLEVKFIGKDDEKGTLAAMYADIPGVNGETGYLAFKVDGKELTDVSKILWKAGAGANFKKIGKLDLEFYRYAGATLYFTYSDGESPLSKIVKVKVKKQANAPNVKVDGAKSTIAIKKGMEYRVTTEGETGAWQTPAEGKAFVPISGIKGLKGDGLFTPYEDAVIEVRTAATEKSQSSKSTFVYLDKTELPVFGEGGIEVKFLKGGDDTGGLLIKNNWYVDYEVAIVEKYSWESEGIKDLILKIDDTAKKGTDGYVSWKKVGEKKTVKVAYKEYKDYKEGEGYIILVRLASVKENNKTPEREFRIKGAVRPYGGMTPEPFGDRKPGTYMIDGSEQVTVTFSEEPGFKLFTAFGNAEFAENTEGKLEFQASVGNTYTIKAYFFDETTGEKGPVKNYVYRFISDEELDEYKDKFGYNYFKKLDGKLGKGNNYTLLYQRLYRACITYEPEVDISDLTLDKDIMLQVVASLDDDNPELLQIDGGYTFTTSWIRLNLRDREFCERLLNECEHSLVELTDRIVSKYGSVENATRLQRVKEIHDYLIQKKQYKNSDMSQTMAGSLSEDYTPVCMSYTLAMKWCCDRLGVQCEIRYGNIKRERHAWNIINYGEPVDYSDPDAVYNTDDWYEMDVTWDDPVGGDSHYIGYKYFNVTTDFIETTRTITTGGYHDGPVPRCTGTEYSWDRIKNDF